MLPGSVERSCDITIRARSFARWQTRLVVAVGLMIGALTMPLVVMGNDVAPPEVAAAAAPITEAPITDAKELMAGAIDLTRGLSSIAKFSMTIKRPSWERTSTLEAWTRGRDDALIRFTAPAKDAGNATLKQGEKMWTYTPKLNKTIRLPFSLMSQSWAGSDFSYTDLSRSDDLLQHYHLRIASSVFEDGHWIYTIEAIPTDDAPVVWGMERLVIRDDFVLMKQTFFDQEMMALKEMRVSAITEMGGRTMGTHMRMVPLDKPDQYTELVYEEMKFDVELEDRLFTLFSLKSGRR